MIAMDCKCDYCRVRLDDGESIVCSGHLDDANEEISKLKEKIADIESELEEAYNTMKEAGI